MNWGAWLVWGFGCTGILTVMLAGAQALGYTRMSITYLLGTLFTPDRDKAKLVGALVHFVNGWIFSLVYVATFHVWGRAAWWVGAVVGLVHSLFVLCVLLPALPALHPRMARPAQGPTEVRVLEPPGFLALHYGTRTPVWVVLSHLAFGALLGALYRVPGT